MNKKRALVKPPDNEADQVTLVKASKRDLKESLDETPSLDHLAELTQALKKAKKKGKK